MAGTRDFVRVLVARSIEEAELVKGLLESNDIPAFLEDGHSEVGGMPMSVLENGVPVLVPNDMKAEAEALLAEQHISAEEEQELDRQAEETPQDAAGESE